MSDTRDHTLPTSEHTLHDTMRTVFSLLSTASVGVFAAASSSFPLLPIEAADTWPAKAGSLYYGDVRAAVTLTPPASGTTSTQVQIWWRRADSTPEKKELIVTNAAGKHMTLSDTTVEGSCGVTTIQHSSTDGSAFFVYYLAHYQSGGNANTHFHWYNCTDQADHDCVLSGEPLAVCGTVLPGAGFVTKLENRPPPQAADHTPSGEPFHGFTAMEMVATAEEVAAVVAQNPSFAVFMENREHTARLFDALPAQWARSNNGASVTSLHASAQPGEYFTYQIGVYGVSGTTTIKEVIFSDLIAPAGRLPSSAATCFNMGGLDMHGIPFTRNTSIAVGKVGVLWMGIDFPMDTPVGIYAGSVKFSLEGGSVVGPYNVTLNVSGEALQDHGDADVYKFRRLRWLNSDLGINSNVSAQYTPIKLRESPTPSPLEASLVNKRVTIGSHGFPTNVVVNTTKTVKGTPTPIQTSPLLGETPVMMTAYDVNGKAVVTKVTDFERTSHLDSEVTWRSVHAGAGLQVVVVGRLAYDSNLEMNVTFTTTEALSDITLEVVPNAPKFMVGMGTSGAEFKPIEWRWSADIGNNMFWCGQPDSGVLLKLKGPGDAWNNPLYSKDYSTIPFIPESWGGVGAVSGKHGVSITPTSITTTSGPRTAGSTTNFLFDLILTPAKPLDMAKHWGVRNFQVGYGTPYYSPEAVHAKGASVVTLHQGIPGVVNGTMVNPYINYPFVPDTVVLLENYTTLSHAEGMRVKFYYTIRELSNHAVELYALKALDGEILLDESPYVVPQEGYCHDWDCHGGAAYLHEHLREQYVACWQQTLSNGEIDAAVCDIGTSRWFNYYVEGLHWSVSQAPHMDGIYFDGINFDFSSMRRLRKVLESAASARKDAPLIDIHTGTNGAIAPAGPLYAAHFAHADSAWNGEGFDWSGDENYWLVEVSAFIYGLPADRLGDSGVKGDYKGMVFGMTQRNSGSASGLWGMWDECGIETTAMVGFWDDVSLQGVTLVGTDPKVKLTSFVHYASHAVIAVGSWSANTASVALQFNSDILGGVPTVVSAPSISGIQNQYNLTTPTTPFTVKPSEGALFCFKL